jgi:hypothetical protein
VEGDGHADGLGRVRCRVGGLVHGRCGHQCGEGS